jgi:hypothetical protein
MPRPKVILNLYPVFPAAGFADRVARRPIGADRDLYHGPIRIARLDAVWKKPLA